MFKFTAVVATLASLASVQAISAGCTGQIAGLALGNLGQCLQITSLLPLVQGSSGSLVDPLNNYLNSFCASSTPVCSNDTLNSANSSIASGCSSDISAGGTDGATISALQAILQFYPQVRTAGCAKNSTTNQYCLTSTISQAQNISGTSLDATFLFSLISGTGNGASQLAAATNGGQLCTGCVQTIYNAAVSANATIAQSSAGKAIVSACPAFASQSATGVSAASSAPASTSGSGSAASSSAAAATSSRSAGTASALSNGVVVGAVAMLGPIVVGSALVL